MARFDAAYFGWLEHNVSAVLAKDPAALTRALAVAVPAKPTSSPATRRRPAIACSSTWATPRPCAGGVGGLSDRLLHGEAVAVGICLAFRLSERLGLLGNNSVARVETHLAAIDLPIRIADIPGEPAPDAAALLKIMGQDKKVRGGALTLILARGIGEAFITPYRPKTVLDFLAARPAADSAASGTSTRAISCTPEIVTAQAFVGFAGL